MPGHENNGKRTLGKRTPCTQSLTGTIGTMYKTFSFDAKFPLFSLFCFFLEQKQHPCTQMALVSDGCLLTLFYCKQSKQWKQGCSCWSSSWKLVGSDRCTVLLIVHVACKGTPAPNSALGGGRQTQTRFLMGFNSHCSLNQSFQCYFEVGFGERSNMACNPDPDFLLGWLFSTYSNFPSYGYSRSHCQQLSPCPWLKFIPKLLRQFPPFNSCYCSLQLWAKT